MHPSQFGKIQPRDTLHYLSSKVWGCFCRAQGNEVTSSALTTSTFLGVTKGKNSDFWTVFRCQYARSLKNKRKNVSNNDDGETASLPMLEW